MSSINITLDSVNENKRRGYTYKDIDFKFILLDNGFDFKTFQDINSIRNGLKNIFTWRRGQRIILPEFGNVLYQYLYEPMTTEVLKNMQTEVVNMIQRWEPRVSIVKVNLVPYPDDNEVMIQLTYVIPTLSNETIEFSTIINDIDQ